MDLYTFVGQHRNNLLVRGYDKHEQVVRVIDDYRPYIFVSTREATEWRTLRGQSLTKLTFRSIREADDYCRQYGATQNIYGLTNWKYLWLYDTFGTSSTRLLSGEDRIRIAYLDLEIDSRQGLPRPESPDSEILTLVCKVGDRLLAFGTRPDTRTDAEYYMCTDERSMLRAFSSFWQSVLPDVVTGWNIESFDIPYLVNRMRRLQLEPEELSPFHLLDERSLPIGVSVLDYLALYKSKKFTQTQQENYKLETIAEVEELPLRKISFEGSHYDFYTRNFHDFLTYNIHDVLVVHELEKKLGLLQLTFAFAYDARVNFTDIYTTVLPWDVYVHGYLADRKIAVDPKPRAGKTSSIAGAYVKDVQPGLKHWVLSFDLTSLYPHIIMSCNISPETLIDYDPSVKDNFEAYLSGHRTFESGDVHCLNGAKFTRKFRGVFPEIMAMLYRQRAEYKAKMLEAERAYQETQQMEFKYEAARYRNLQFAKKIQLNSLFGALSNENFRWFDNRLAEAITMTGQFIIRWLERDINAAMNKFLSTEARDYVIASDTDSLYLDVSDFVARLNLDDRDAICDVLTAFAETNIDRILKRSLANLAQFCGFLENKLSMKREAIADRAIWRAKKMYILRVLDSEGVRYRPHKIKMSGIEAIRSTTPKLCREGIRKCIEHLLNNDEKSFRAVVNEVEEQFMSAPIEAIASPRGVHGLSEYASRYTIYRKGTPLHVRAALLYNHCVRQLQLEHKYPLIEEGGKLYYVYLLLPNRIGENVIGFVDVLPPEFQLDTVIDRQTQFRKTFLDPVTHISEVMNIRYDPTIKTAVLF